jgi:23S rRNA (pseudouridine1915-N3)-methyltransferase
LKTSVVAVGRLRDAHCAGLCDDYAGRIRRFGPLDLVEVKEARGLPRERAIEQEGERILARLPAGCRAVSLDERGRTLTSEQLAKWLADRQRDATRDLRFVVGGAWGLSGGVKARCQESIRLSSMTLPHELARVLLLEQLYRAWTILRGAPYHHR